MRKVLKVIVRTLLLSKLVLFWRRVTSSMRGCCHRPGVEGAGEGCCWGVSALDRGGVCCALETSCEGGTADVVAGENDLDCKFGATRLLEEDEERTSAVVDIVLVLVAVAVISCSVPSVKLVCCAVEVSMLVCLSQFSCDFNAFSRRILRSKSQLLCEARQPKTDPRRFP